jgi:hypothetical protein
MTHQRDITPRMQIRFNSGPSPITTGLRRGINKSIRF